MTGLITIGTFDVPLTQRERFKSGDLWREWHSSYPDLFDDDDLRLAKTQASGGYHFYEWLAAILLFQRTGYLSLVEKYQSENHKQKQLIVKQFNSPELFEALAFRSQDSAYGCPDLLVYAPDFSDWYFCEVKGGADRMRPAQERHYQALQELTGKPIRLVKFRLVRNR